MYRLPLAAYRVLDLGPTRAVAYAARLLGDAGAEVIAVDRETVMATPRSSGYRQVNRNKLGCTLDFATPSGAGLLRRLVSLCDVVIDGFDATEREQLGLNYDALRASRPDLIVASIDGGHGRDSSLDDVVAGTAAAAAACAALLHHRDTGEGQHVEVDARDCLRSFVGGSGGVVSLPAREELPADSRLRERRFFEPVSTMSGVEEMPALPWRFSLTPCHVRLPAPEPGQHNRYVFGLLGLSEAEMADLEREGVIGAILE